MIRLRSTWLCVLLACSPAALAPIAASAQSGTGRFLLISDIHFDPFYDPTLFGQLDSRPVEDWSGILEGSRPPGPNPKGTDSNNALLKGSLDEARRRIPDPDFILYPGDLMAHRWQDKYDRLAAKSHLAAPGTYRAFTTKAIRFLAGEFRKRYPATPILPTLGNDDSYCGDYMIAPDGPFLEMFADAWAPLLGEGVDIGAFRATFNRGGHYSLKLPRIRDHRLIVLNSVVFSTSYDDACGTSTQTPALDQLNWLAETLGRAEAAGESAWLLMHIPPGIDAYNTSKSVPGGGPAVAFWQPELTARFLQLIGRYRSTVRAAFVGHTHKDDFRVIRNGGEPVLFAKIAPSISPIFGNNPGFQVYRYDRESGALQDYRTFFLPGLPGDEQDAAPEGGPWALEYDFRDAYGLPALDADAVARLVEGIATDPAARRRYTAYYNVGAAPEFDARTIDVYRCAITNVTPSEFLTCYRGVPKPRRPPPAPGPVGVVGSGPGSPSSSGVRKVDR